MKCKTKNMTAKHGAYHVSRVTYHAALRAARDAQRGAGIMEILLALAIVALLAPQVYGRISETAREIRDIGTARKVMALREPALNFVRLNQENWPDTAQILLDPEELAQITDAARFAFVDKYLIKGAIVTDIYLAFDIGDDALRAARIAKHIGSDAATVMPDKVAYSASWAATAPDFRPGDLVYKVNYNFSADDNSKYLHRGTSGEDDLNVMRRNLNMGAFGIVGIGAMSAESGKIAESSASFAETAELTSSSLYFSSGANVDGNSVNVGAMRVNGDITGFRNISAARLNRDGFSTSGSIIADRAKINNSVIVGGAMKIKSESARTVSGFAGIVAHSLATPYVSADEIYFMGSFGLTVSGELLMSATAPLRIGNWTFPSNTAPKFAKFELSRAKIPATPDSSEFGVLMGGGWKDARPRQ
jgi:hypothetical protein